jgi:peptidase M1-like protein
MIRVFFSCLLSLLVLVGCAFADQSPNADGNYQQLRNITVGSEAITVNNATLKRDAATFQLNSGTLCFLSPVGSKVTGAIFVGEGRLLLTPPIPAEGRNLNLLTRQQEFSESFSKLVLRFTDDTYKELKSAGTPGSPTSCDPGLLADSQHAARKKLHYNLDARLLQDVLSPEPGGFFYAFVHGKNYSDKMIFAIDPHGLPDVYPEEIELQTYEDNKEGLWAAFHYTSEYASGKATSAQKNNVVHIEHQQLDMEIEKSGRLIGKSVTSFVARTNGVRVVPFSLFPTLRVKTVTAADGQVLNFIQEDKLDDPQFWVVLPKALNEGDRFMVNTTYDGKDAVINESNGNYFPVAREDWYPNAAAGIFGEYTDYDMTFRIPKNMKMAATGNLVSEANQGDRNVTVWKSPVPLAVAGFNFGRFKVVEAKLDKPEMDVLSYANEDPPDWVQSVARIVNDNNAVADAIGGSLGNMSTVELSKKALAEGELALRIYTDYFGPIGYKRMQITQQTATNFGQSWPGLVYLPMSYLFDPTTRHTLGNIMRRMYPSYTDDPYGYFSVVAPHEVAHQWWGHAVGFNSYRDQWMSEGFAETSASIYMQIVYAKDPQKYLKFWSDERKMLTERNTQGFRAIDAGPLVMGYRVSNTRAGFDSYRRLIYPKGGYVLHMLRQMMYSRQTGDENFKEMMRDFVSTYSGKVATTQDFKSIVEKHITPEMDLTNDHKMDWFFREWVYGTAIPTYSFDYSFEKNTAGDVVLKYKLTQSGVDKNFGMPVPIYLELANGKIIHLGAPRMIGNYTNDQSIALTGLKDTPRRAMINYNYDVLSSMN